MTSAFHRRPSPSIRDQGPRGTCVAFAGTTAHELASSEDLELSPEFLFWGAKRRDGLGWHEDGTTLEAAIDALHSDGQAPETSWPYDPVRDHRVSTYGPPAAATTEARQRQLSLSGDRIIAPTSSAIRRAVLAGSAVVLILRIYEQWLRVAADGLLVAPSATEALLGNHAVAVVGLRPGSLVIQNSWGSGWAQDGIAYLPDLEVDRHARAAWSIDPFVRT